MWFHGSMRPLTIADAPTVALGLQEEIRRCEESRYDHRLHGVLLVAEGLTCPEVAALLGDSRRTVEYWVRRFEAQGLAGLREGERPGRPRRLNPGQRNDVSAALRLPPGQYGLSGNLWDGKLLATYLQQRHRVSLGVRQCQRLFRQLGFRLRKPRPAIAHADPQRQKAFKKTSGPGPRPRGRTMGR
jgi:transposase